MTIRVCLLTICCCLSGCATLFSPRLQRVSFESVPPGAVVKVDGKKLGVTPLSVDLVRDSDSVAVIGMDGYKDQVFPMASHINPWFWGDVILLSPIGVLVDFGDHTAVAYRPDHYAITLQQANATDDPRRLGGAPQTISRFISENYRDIGRELVKGAGPHMEQLIAMLGVTAADSAPTSKVLRDTYTNSTGAPAFTRAVLTRFGLSG